MIWRRFLLAAAFLTAGWGGLGAHPHVYIDMELALVWDGAVLEGVEQRWTLLRDFGTGVVEEFDRDGNGIFDEEETEEIRRQAFEPISPYHYYTEIGMGNRSFRPRRVEDFSAEIAGGRAVYSFFIPCGIQAEPEPREVEIAVFDPSSYVSFSLIYVDDPAAPGADYSLDITWDGSIYSHGNKLGFARLVMTLERTDAGDGKPAENELLSAGAVDPPPEQTIRNPFLLPGLKLGGRKSSPNPFLSY